MADRRTLLIIAPRDQKFSAVHMQGSCGGVKLEGGLIEGEGEGRVFWREKALLLYLRRYIMVVVGCNLVVVVVDVCIVMDRWIG